LSVDLMREAADALSDDSGFVQEDEELGDDFEGGVELAYRDHKHRPQEVRAPSVYQDVRSTLLGERPTSGLSTASSTWRVQDRRAASAA